MFTRVYGLFHEMARSLPCFKSRGKDSWKSVSRRIHMHSRFGVPLQLQSDQGRNFCSNIFTEMCHLLDIKKTQTTPYHPQSDGLVERFNRTLATQLSMFVESHQRDWDEYVPYLLMAYRTAVHESTKTTPAKLMMGHEIRIPIDLKRFEVGDSVWLFSSYKKKGLAKKLMRPWTGPYLVIKRLNDLVYKIRLTPQSKPKIVHKNRLWKYSGRVRETEDIALRRSKRVRRQPDRF